MGHRANVEAVGGEGGGGGERGAGGGGMHSMSELKSNMFPTNTVMSDPRSAI